MPKTCSFAPVKTCNFKPVLTNTAGEENENFQNHLVSFFCICSVIFTGCAEAGGGTAYSAGTGIITLTENITLYAGWVEFELLDTGPAGGWVFYDAGSFEDHNSDGISWRYLECAPEDALSSYWGTYNNPDWYLPAKNELGLIYSNIAAHDAGNFSSELSGVYWSSTESLNRYAWYTILTGGSIGTQNSSVKNNQSRVRPVRKF